MQDEAVLQKTISRGYSGISGILKPMPAIFSTMGGTTLVLVVGGIQLLSLFIMTAISLEYIHIQRKRMTLLNALESTEGKADLKHGTLLMFVYIVATIIISVAVMLLFVFRPDFL